MQDATRSGWPLDIRAQLVTASASVVRQNSSPLAFLRMLSNPWAVGHLTRSSITGGTSKLLLRFMLATRTTRSQDDHQVVSNAIGTAIWGEPMFLVGWVIPIALGVHPPPPSSFAPRRSRPTVDFFGTPRRLPTRTGINIYWRTVPTSTRWKNPCDQHMGVPS